MQIKKVILEDEQGNQIPATFETKDGVLIVAPNRGCGIPKRIDGYWVARIGNIGRAGEDIWIHNHGVFTSPERAEWFGKCVPYLDQCYKAFVGEVKDDWSASLVFNPVSFHYYITDCRENPYFYRFPTREMAEQFLYTHQEILDKIKHAVIF
jgi:hypothetical protein